MLGCTMLVKKGLQTLLELPSASGHEVATVVCVLLYAFWDESGHQLICPLGVNVLVFCARYEQRRDADSNCSHQLSVLRILR